MAVRYQNQNIILNDLIQILKVGSVQEVSVHYYEFLEKPFQDKLFERAKYNSWRRVEQRKEQLDIILILKQQDKFFAVKLLVVVWNPFEHTCV